MLTLILLGWQWWLWIGLLEHLQQCWFIHDVDFTHIFYFMNKHESAAICCWCCYFCFHSITIIQCTITMKLFYTKSWLFFYAEFDWSGLNFLVWCPCSTSLQSTPFKGEADQKTNIFKRQVTCSPHGDMMEEYLWKVSDKLFLFCLICNHLTWLDLQRSHWLPTESTAVWNFRELCKLHSGLFIPTWIRFLIWWQNDDLFLLNKTERTRLSERKQNIFTLQVLLTVQNSKRIQFTQWKETHLHTGDAPTSFYII